MQHTHTHSHTHKQPRSRREHAPFPTCGDVFIQYLPGIRHSPRAKVTGARGHQNHARPQPRRTCAVAVTTTTTTTTAVTTAATTTTTAVTTADGATTIDSGRRVGQMRHGRAGAQQVKSVLKSGAGASQPVGCQQYGTFQRQAQPAPHATCPLELHTCFVTHVHMSACGCGCWIWACACAGACVGAREEVCDGMGKSTNAQGLALVLERIASATRLVSTATWTGTKNSPPGAQYKHNQHHNTANNVSSHIMRLPLLGGATDKVGKQPQPPPLPPPPPPPPTTTTTTTTLLLHTYLETVGACHVGQRVPCPWQKGYGDRQTPQQTGSGSTQARAASPRSQTSPAPPCFPAGQDTHEQPRPHTTQAQHTHPQTPTDTHKHTHTHTNTTRCHAAGLYWARRTTKQQLGCRGQECERTGGNVSTTSAMVSASMAPCSGPTPSSTTNTTAFGLSTEGGIASVQCTTRSTTVKGWVGNKAVQPNRNMRAHTHSGEARTTR